MKILLNRLKLPVIILSVCFDAALLQSCNKSVDPIATKSSDVTKSNITVPLQTGPNSNGGTTTDGSSSGGSTSGGTNSGGTISNDGNGGVAIGSSGTIVFTLNGKTYTLTNNGTTYGVGATYNPAAGSVTKDFTVIAGLGSANDSIAFSLSLNETSTGIFDIGLLNITLADGTSYTTARPAVGKINFNTYAKDANDNVTTKGTFDAILINDAKSTDIIRVSGSFNLIP